VDSKWILGLIGIKYGTAKTAIYIVNRAFFGAFRGFSNFPELVRYKLTYISILVSDQNYIN